MNARERPQRPDRSRERDPRTGADAPAARIRQQTSWVDLQVRQAVARGDFDGLPGYGKPIDDLTGEHDPDWWVKKLIEREQITGVLPPALALRKEDAELDGALDREASEDGVRRAVEDFNRRVVDARRQLLGGPPVVTPTRDPEREVVAWRARRAERRDRQRELLQQAARREDAPARGRRQRRRWWHRRTPG